MANGITRKPSKTKTPHLTTCMCGRCKRNRERTFNLSARFAANRIASQGGRSVTAALPNDGIFTRPFTRTAQQSEIVGLHDDGSPIVAIFSQTDASGNLVPDENFKGNGITDTQLTIKPLFSPIGRDQYQQHSNVTVATPEAGSMGYPPDFIGPLPEGATLGSAGIVVVISEKIAEVHQTSGLVPVRSLLRRSANFDPDWGAYKRRTSRSKEVTRPDKGNGPIDAEVSRLSYRRPEFLDEQARQEVKYLDLSLGLPNPEITDLVADKTNSPLAAELPETIDDEIASLTDWD